MHAAEHCNILICGEWVVRVVGSWVVVWPVGGSVGGIFTRWPVLVSRRRGPCSGLRVSWMA